MFDCNDWVRIQPLLRLPDRDCSVTWDRGHQRVAAMVNDFVLGANPLCYVHGDTIEQGPSVPAGAGGISQGGRRIVSDGARGELVVFGGIPTAVDSTFVLRNGSWQQLSPPVRPPGRYDHAFVDDPVRQRVVLYGGTSGPTGAETPRADTWEWDCVEEAQARRTEMT